MLLQSGASLTMFIADVNLHHRSIERLLMIFKLNKWTEHKANESAEKKFTVDLGNESLENNLITRDI